MAVRPPPDAWIGALTVAMTAEDWAEQALAAAAIKKTRRPFLRQHLARTITEAQTAAVRDAKAHDPAWLQLIAITAICENFEEDGFRDPAKAMKAVGEAVGKYWETRRDAEHQTTSSGVLHRIQE
jgi:hypothetical protein